MVGRSFVLDTAMCIWYQVCQCKTDGLRTVKLRVLPQVLTCTLGRFAYDKNIGKHTKVDTSPRPMQPLCTSSAPYAILRPALQVNARFGLDEEIQVACDGGGLRTYQLYGMVAHTGSAQVRA